MAIKTKERATRVKCGESCEGITEITNKENAHKEIKERERKNKKERKGKGMKKGKGKRRMEK